MYERESKATGAAFACVIGSNLSLVGSGNANLFPLQTKIVVVARYHIDAQPGSSHAYGGRASPWPSAILCCAN